jgi:hypothetical protein
MARFGVRSGSDGFAHVDGSPAKTAGLSERARTGANVAPFAMQKVDETGQRSENALPE